MNKENRALKLVNEIIQFNDKVYTFLSKNNFHTIPNDHTTKDDGTIQKALQQCDKIINRT